MALLNQAAMCPYFACNIAVYSSAWAQTMRARYVNLVMSLDLLTGTGNM